MAGTVTVNLLQALHRPLVRRAPPMHQYPTAPIAAADLPYAITIPSEGRTFDMGGGYQQEIRQYTVIVYTEALAQNTIPLRLVEVTNLIATFSNTYSNRRNAALQDPAASNNNYQITITTSNDNAQTDTGVVSDLAVGGQAYHGFRYTITVREKWPLNQ